MSVAVVNYNYGRYLADAIDSALNQMSGPIEVVVVDDGSTDESLDVLASYGKRVVAVLRDNGGQAAALNTALQHCSGQIICLLDSDDLMLPNRVRRLREVYDAHPQCQWVFHGIDLIARRTRTHVSTWSSQTYTAGFHDERRHMRCGRITMNAPATSALSWRAPFVQSLLPIPELITAPDNYLKFASLAMAPGWVIGQPLSLQGIHDSNIYSTLAGHRRRASYLRNGVRMAPRFDQLGLPMVAERLMADALITAHGRTALDTVHRDLLWAWAASLPWPRKLRLAAFCAAVGADAAVHRTRTFVSRPLRDRLRGMS